MTRIFLILCLGACARAPEGEPLRAESEAQQPLWLLGRGGQLLQMSGDVRQERVFDTPATALTRFDRYLAWASGAGHVWHSSDGGATWLAQLVPVRDQLHAVSFSSPTHGVAVGDRGVVLATEDGGAHWRNLELPGLLPLRTVKLARQSGNAIAGGDAGALLRSSDSGRTWTAMALPHNDAVLASDINEDGSVAVIAGSHGRAALLTAAGLTHFAAGKSDWLAVRLTGAGVVLAGQGGALWVCASARECKTVAGANEDLVSIALHHGVFVLGRSGTLYRLSDLTLEPVVALSDATLLSDLP